MRRTLARLRGDERAVVMVEFIVAFVPILLLFLATIELTRLSIAGLMLQRAAGKAVRACAVIQEQPVNCEPGASAAAEQQRLVTLAAQRAILPMTALAVRGARCQVDRMETDTVQVNAEFYCAVPMVRGLVCSSLRPGEVAIDPAQTSVRQLTATARYAHQGAHYDCDFSAPVLLGQ